MNTEIITQEILIDLTDPHPDNELLFGPILLDDEFLDSLRTEGQLHPAIASGPLEDGRYRIISGHRRRAGLIAIGAITMRTEIRRYESAKHESRHLVLCNLQRSLSNATRVSILRPLFDLTESELILDLMHLENMRKTQSSSNIKKTENDSPLGAGNGSKYSKKVQFIAAISGLTEKSVDCSRPLLDSEKFAEIVIDPMKQAKADAKLLEDAARQREELIVMVCQGEIGITKIPTEVHRLRDLLLRRCPKFREKKAPSERRGRPLAHRHLLKQIDADTELSIMGEFTSNKLNVQFGSVFFDMEQRPAVRVPAGIFMIDIQALVDQHLTPMLKKG